jgi:hypothetical protein
LPAAAAPAHADLEFSTTDVLVHDVLGEGEGHRLGITGSGETAHAHIAAGRDQASGFFGTHDLVQQGLVVDA